MHHRRKLRITLFFHLPLSGTLLTTETSGPRSRSVENGTKWILVLRDSNTLISTDCTHFSSVTLDNERQLFRSIVILITFKLGYTLWITHTNDQTVFGKFSYDFCSFFFFLVMRLVKKWQRNVKVQFHYDTFFKPNFSFNFMQWIVIFISVFVCDLWETFGSTMLVGNIYLGTVFKRGNLSDSRNSWSRTEMGIFNHENYKFMNNTKKGMKQFW